MSKKKLYNDSHSDQHDFFERLFVAYAPVDDLMIQAVREKKLKERIEERANGDASHRKLGLGVRFAVRHLGSI